MRRLQSFLLALYHLTLVNSAALRHRRHPIDRLIFFGDSYTDQSRSHSISNGTYPGKDYQQVYPPADTAASGGFQWP